MINKTSILLGLFLTSSALFLTPTVALAVPIQNLNSQTGATQTFSNDTNVTITSANNVHSLSWNGILSVLRGGTGANSFSNGSLLFFNGSTFAQDNSNLFWDNSNNRLGIGTSSPASTLEVNGNTSISGDFNTGYITTLGVEGSTFADFKVRAKSGDEGHPDGAITYLYSGDGFGSGTAGHLYVAAGDGGDTGNGGELNLFAGRGGTTSGNGGILTIRGGGVEGSIGNGGSVDFIAGRGVGGGTNGSFNFYEPTTTYKGTLDFSSISADRTFTFPNASGTFGLLQVDQTWSGLNRFEANSNSTIYVGSSVKSGCIAMGDSDGSGITYITANDGSLTASATKPGICQ